MKKLIGCVAALAMFVGGALWAQQADDQTDVKVATRAGDSRVFAGVDWNHNRGKQGTDKMSGNPWGGVVGYEYIEADYLYFHVKGYWGGGRMKGTEGGSEARSYDHAWFVDGRIGWMFGLGQENEFGIAPYVGIGYDTVRASFNLPSEQKIKEYGWWLPFGIYFDWNVVPEFNIGLNAQCRWDFNQKMEVKSGTNAGNSTKGKHRFNWLFELPLKYQLTSEWDLNLVPYYMHERFVPKTNTTAFGTDHMKDTIWGARLELGYSF